LNPRPSIYYTLFITTEYEDKFVIIESEKVSTKLYYLYVYSIEDNK